MATVFDASVNPGRLALGGRAAAPYAAGMVHADTALSELPGIGPTRRAGLAGLGLETVWDLLHAVPRCLGPPPPLCEQGELEPGRSVRLRAQLLTVARRFTRGRGLGLEATLARADGR